jgi:ubiquinone/menaquinone biosynthesis C-methylase UbiE
MTAPVLRTPAVFRLFATADGGVDPAVADDLDALLAVLRRAVREQQPPWADHPVIREYAAMCGWTIRTLEYGFVSSALAGLAGAARARLRVLDVGSGVAPLCNWISRRGPEVVAVDPLFSSIAAVVGERLNDLHGSHVRYAGGRGEQLPFPDASFDAVTCVSVLEHLPPGNDRIALAEMARVLKTGGSLLLTFDVAPPPPLQDGEGVRKEHLRRHAQPYTAVHARRLLDHVASHFDGLPGELPEGLKNLSQAGIHTFWRATQERDGRVEALREYVALGVHLRRNEVPVIARSAEQWTALLEGQDALEERLGYYQYHARKRLQVIDEMVEQEDVEATRVSPDVLSELAEHDEHLRQIDDRLAAIESSLRATSQVVEHHIAGTWRSRLKRRLSPRLGRLRQYAPRPLVIPERYRRCTPPLPAPVVSIVTPSLNQAPFLERSIRSVVSQAYPRLEYVVQDGASSDETEAILRRHRSTFTHCESLPDGGQARALNLGFGRTTGEIMAFLNADDVLLPGALSYVVSFFAKHPRVDVLYGHRVLIDEADAEIGVWVLPPHDDRVLAWADLVPQESLFWRRRIWEKAGGRVDESYRFALDWDLLLRFREAGARFARVPRFLAAFRVHPAQKTSVLLDTVGQQEMDRIRERCHGRPVAPLEIRAHLRPYLLRHLLFHHLFRLGLLRY